MKTLFFDIETLARPLAVACLPEPSAPAHYKDPDKIAAYIAEKRAAQIREAALDPDTGEIGALALQFHPGKEPIAILTGSEFTEQAILSTFWTCAEAAQGYLVGYNILAFDLPFILRRSLALGVKPSYRPRLHRYQIEPICDLYSLLYGWQPGKSLKVVASLYGINNPLAPLNGGDVAQMDEATLRQYVANDVQLCTALYERMAGIYFDKAGGDLDDFPF